MSAAHTSGPWTADKHGHIWVDGDGVMEGRHLLTVKRAADARLIAAAPELYEALQELASEVATAGLSLALLDRLDASHSKARTALAKARGEA